MKNRLFEVPYNFDKNLGWELIKYKNNIKSIYVPSYFEDSDDTRRIYMKDVYPKSREEYMSHLQFLLNLGFEISILFQGSVKNLSSIKEYTDLGIRSFIVKFDETAEAIKKIDPTITVIASITQKLNVPQILRKRKDLYDEVILFFPYNKNINVIKKLPKHFKYTLLVNSSCSVFCSASEHLYLKDEKKLPLFCRKDSIDSMVIPRDLLSFFDDKVDFYKLAGRELPTEKILKIVRTYFTAPQYDLSNIREKEAFFAEYSEFIFEYLKEDYLHKNVELTKDKYIIQKENIKIHYNQLVNYDWFYKDIPEDKSDF